MNAFKLFAVSLCLFLLSGAAQSAPDSDPWPRWEAHDSDAAAVIDHAPWDHFLNLYAKPGNDGVTRIAYGQVSSEERASLEEYLESLTQTRISDYRRDEQLAFWINLYNALTIKVILDHYPVESIRDITLESGFFDLFTAGPWGAEIIEVEGEDLSLDDIEHRILRPIWQDPRIHYAVNCASLGCPNLARKAYRGGIMEEMLDAAAREFINHPRGIAADEDGLVLSSIYDWFAEDFGEGTDGLIAHLALYAEGSTKDLLSGSPSISDYAYDWRLNDIDTPAPTEWLSGSAPSKAELAAHYSQIERRR